MGIRGFRILLIALLSVQDSIQLEEYLCSVCGEIPIVRYDGILPTIPANFTISPEKYFQFTNKIQGYRFVNPGGVAFDGIGVLSDAITAHARLADHRPTSDFSWFEGYAWQILLSPPCTKMPQDSRLLGWKFFRIDSSPDRIQSFAYMLVDNVYLCDTKNVLKTTSSVEILAINNINYSDYVSRDVR